MPSILLEETDVVRLSSQNEGLVYDGMYTVMRDFDLGKIIEELPATDDYIGQRFELVTTLVETGYLFPLEYKNVDFIIPSPTTEAAAKLLTVTNIPID